MQLTELKEYLPVLVLVAGVLLFVWTKRSNVMNFLKKLWPQSKLPSSMSPEKRFTTFYALRQWCDCCAYEEFQEAVKALDEKVLPIIVMDAPEVEL